MKAIAMAECRKMLVPNTPLYFLNPIPVLANGRRIMFVYGAQYSYTLGISVLNEKQKWITMDDRASYVEQTVTALKIRLKNMQKAVK